MSEQTNVLSERLNTINEGSDISNIFNNNFMPYIIKWGKLTTWASILFIMFPPLVITFIYGGSVSFSQILAGLIPIVSAMLVWYIVDPISLYPILGIPGLYITYIAGNSKEIRVPSALVAMGATGYGQGTPKGTIISTYAIANSVFVSVIVMTIGIVFGQVLLDNAPPQVVIGLKYLLPALFGGMLGERIVQHPKIALMIALPLAFIARIAFLNGLFSFFPMGGNYMEILIAVFGSMYAIKYLETRKQKNGNK